MGHIFQRRPSLLRDVTRDCAFFAQSRISERAEAVAKSLHLDDGINLPELSNNMGAMVSDAQRDKAEAMVTAAVADGAELVRGGRCLKPSRSISGASHNHL